MTRERARRPKLLFILSNDYGELSNALYLVTGCNFQTVLLMPDRLFTANREGLSARARCYHSLSEVMDAVAEEKPDVVLLFSGYLYAINKIFAGDDVVRLVQDLRSRNCLTVTSDPFLGILSRLDDSTFSDLHPQKCWLTDHFSWLAGVLRNVRHLYLTPPDESAPAGSVSFFNANIIRVPSRIAEGEKELVERLGVDPLRKQWLFVLSLEDYGSQIGVHGRDRFDGILLDKLRQAIQEGRQPVLVGPQPCITSLTNQHPALDGVIRLPFCSHDLFASLLFSAEYAFYWNIFSNSVLPRIVNQLPVFFFDRGHMVHAIQPLFELGMKCYYADSELPYLEQEGKLASEELAFRAGKQKQALRAARINLQRSPPPEEMMGKLLQD